MIKGYILNNSLKNRFSFWFSECGLCKAYLLYVDDVRIRFFFPFGGVEIRSDYLSREVSDYLLVELSLLSSTQPRGKVSKEKKHTISPPLPPKLFR